MPRTTKPWHPNFYAYMDKIVHHPNYAGLPIERRADGGWAWVAPAKSAVGQARIRWCEQKARALGFAVQPGVYADVMLAIHPTKRKVCQTCGRELSLYYHYPNANLQKALHKRFGREFGPCDHIADIWDALLADGVPEQSVAAFFIQKGALPLRPEDGKTRILDALELACRKGNKNCLGPGAMSNFPDRFDGFHTYNRCCRGTQDKGRAAENMKTYTKDRRAYAYWSDGNLHAADQYMGSRVFDGISADHLGPISLGFVHDPRYLRPMLPGDNAAKRDRLLPDDVREILQTQQRTGVYPMSWYSAQIWEHLCARFDTQPYSLPAYRELLKQNQTNYFYILGTILKKCPERGETLLTEAFLAPKFADFDYDYTFAEQGTILSQTRRHRTARSSGEQARYQRLAMQAVRDHMEKENRNRPARLTAAERAELAALCCAIQNGADVAQVRHAVEQLMQNIQQRALSALEAGI